MKVVAAASVTGGGVPCWALLLPGLGWQGPEVVEDVLGGSGSRCRCAAGLRLGLGLGGGLRSWCFDRFGWLLGGGLGFRPGCGRGFCWGMGLGGGGGARGGDGLGGPFWRLSPRLGGWCAGRGCGVVADEVVVVVEVVESQAGERSVGDAGGSCAAGGARQMLGPVSNEDKGVGSGIVCVRALSLVSRVRAGAGAVGGVVCGTRWRGGVVSAAPASGLSGGVHFSSRTYACVCWR